MSAEQHDTGDVAPRGIEFGWRASASAGLTAARAPRRQVLATHAGREDFEKLATRLGENTTKIVEAAAAYHKSGSVTKNPDDVFAPFYASEFSDASLEFLRAEAFPEDAALHRAFCGG